MSGRFAGAVAFVFPLALGLAFCRGLFDLFGAQTVGYLVQYASVGIVVAATLLRISVARLPLPVASRVKIAIAFAFVVLASISWELTLLRTAVWQGVIYVGVMIFWTFYVVTMGVAASLLQAFPLEKALVLPLVANLGVALLEQSGRIVMPGSGLYGEFVRPAGLTGSMQHYAITMAIGGCFYLQAFHSTKRPGCLALALALLCGAMASLTRSAYLIISTTLTLLLVGAGMRVLV